MATMEEGRRWGDRKGREKYIVNKNNKKMYLACPAHPGFIEMCKVIYIVFEILKLCLWNTSSYVNAHDTLFYTALALLLVREEMLKLWWNLTSPCSCIFLAPACSSLILTKVHSFMTSTGFQSTVQLLSPSSLSILISIMYYWIL